MRMSNLICVDSIILSMGTKKRQPFGIAHVTVVPENYDPDDARRDAEDHPAER